VRFHAAEWHIDPHKAGGHLVAAISTHNTKRLYPAVDAADKENCRSDFAVPIYQASVAFRGGMGREARPQEVCDFSSGGCR